MGALLIEWLRIRGRTSGDLALALVFYGGIAAAVVIASRTDSGTVNVLPYLFGSILTVSHDDVRVILGLGIAIVVVVTFLGRALFATLVDEESARVAGVPVVVCNSALAVLTAVTVVAAMRVVGVLLIAALMVVPVAASRQFARSFRGTLVGSVVTGLVAVVGGLAAARQWGLAPGGTIVLAAVALFALSLAARGLRRARITTLSDPRIGL